jgi:hypothetical protein
MLFGAPPVVRILALTGGADTVCAEAVPRTTDIRMTAKTNFFRMFWRCFSLGVGFLGTVDSCAVEF